MEYIIINRQDQELQPCNNSIKKELTYEVSVPFTSMTDLQREHWLNTGNNHKFKKGLYYKTITRNFWILEIKDLYELNIFIKDQKEVIIYSDYCDTGMFCIELI